ncbi:MAG: transglycosylase SLT domain-containing protein [Nitrospirae bacterium]|nr:transglycosylase SLT domain-containing protein [Nitrospirota bacterium]
MRRKVSVSTFKPFFLLLMVLLPLLIFCLRRVSAEYPEGKAFLKIGKACLDAGRHEEAVKHLAQATSEYPLLGDYALLYLSDAYHKLGEHKKAYEALRTLIGQYPASSLIRKARISEIREVKENLRPDLSTLYEAYVRDYPDDDEISLAYGYLLRQAGEQEKATAVFKGVYLKAGYQSHRAYAELNSKDITPSDTITRASALIKRYEFKEAEKELRRALKDGDGRHKEEILKNLGLALFRQKDYKEAAAVYSGIPDHYSTARSMYRAGDRQGFEEALGTLIAANDKRAGSLLLSVAADKRRGKDFGEAVRLYRDVLGRYPLEREEALWGIGWTHYLAAEYKKSSEIFSELYAKYGDPKYLYWRAKSAEAAGEDTGPFYRALAKLENNFYGALVLIRDKGRAASPASFSDWKGGGIPPDRYHRFERVEALLSLDMPREAVQELVYATQKTESLPGLLYVVGKFNELGEFRRAIGVATTIPYSEKMHRFWYPLAFWEDVESISKKNDIDPLFALSVMREESRFDADARSVAGARGLMQIMPQTAYQLDRSLKLGITRESQINDIRNNITLGTYYLRSLVNEFRSLAHVLAAYNAGEVMVRKWEHQGNYRSVDEFIEDIPFPETRNYVKKVLNTYLQYRKYSSEDSTQTSFDRMLGKL